MSDLQDAHVALRSTDGWKSEEQQVIALCFDFIELVRTTAHAFTRYPDAESWLLQSAMDEFVESAIAIWQLTDSGIYNPAYRELRYLLESAIKFSYVDQKLPGPTPLPDRQRWLHANVPRGSISVVTDLSWYDLTRRTTDLTGLRCHPLQSESATPNEAPGPGAPGASALPEDRPQAEDLTAPTSPTRPVDAGRDRRRDT